MRRYSVLLLMTVVVLLMTSPSSGHHGFDTTWLLDSVEKIKVKRLGSREQDFFRVPTRFNPADDRFAIDYGDDFILGGDIVHTNRSGTKFTLIPDSGALETQLNYLQDTLRLDGNFFNGTATTVEFDDLKWTIKGKVNRSGTKIKITSKAKAKGTAANNIDSVRFGVRYVEKYFAEDVPE